MYCPYTKHMFTFVVILHPLSCSYRMKKQWILIWCMITNSCLDCLFFFLHFSLHICIDSNESEKQNPKLKKPLFLCSSETAVWCFRQDRAFFPETQTWFSQTYLVCHLWAYLDWILEVGSYIFFLLFTGFGEPWVWWRCERTIGSSS